jgi:hypothetical protein
MQAHSTKSAGLRLAVIVFVTLGVAGSATVSSIQNAAATPMANLWAVPVNSRIDDGNYQILRLHFVLDTGNPLLKIRITLDPGTLDEKVLEFDGNGNILVGDPAFVSVDGSIKFKTEGDGYYFLSKLKGKFKIAVDKTELAVGDHDALAEIIRTDLETAQDDAHFKLREGPAGGDEDLVAKGFKAWESVDKNKKHHVFVDEANDGDRNAKRHMISIYMSDDNILDDGDILIGNKDMHGLKAGNERHVHLEYNIPDGTPNGMIYLIVKVDSEDGINESDEGNNVITKQIRLWSK